MHDTSAVFSVMCWTSFFVNPLLKLWRKLNLHTNILRLNLWFWRKKFNQLKYSPLGLVNLVLQLLLLDKLFFIIFLGCKIVSFCFHEWTRIKLTLSQFALGTVYCQECKCSLSIEPIILTAMIHWIYYLKVLSIRVNLMHVGYFNHIIEPLGAHPLRCHYSCSCLGCQARKINMKTN